jgi:hypothetical protein
MRKAHRILAVFAVFFGLYASITGIALQSIDLKTILGHAPADNPDLKAIREGRNGPPNFAVAADSDFSAASLPRDFNFDRALGIVMRSARAVLAGGDVRFVEFRMIGGTPVGQLASGGKLIRIDALSGDVLIGPAEAKPAKFPASGNQPALRNTVKNIHRMLAYGNVGSTLFPILAIGMCAMLFTGLVLYFRLISARRRMKRKALFWSGGGWWRELHRGLAIAASLFLVIVVTSGTIEAIGSFGVMVYRVANHEKRPGLTADVSAPLADLSLPPMLHTTLAAFRAAEPGETIRVLRLRSFAGIAQGVVVKGGEDAQQFAYEATTGQRAGLSGPTYPQTGQTFGWDADQFFKGIHRGDAFGLTGRWMSLLTGFALLFLSISGTIMYASMWNKRRRAGKPNPFW